MLKTVTTARELRMATTDWQRRNETIGFVPTMGALHEGHLALVKKAQSLTTRTVVSIFVNPLQFIAGEDLSNYPRQLEGDAKKLESVNCDLLFAPTPEEMYPPTFKTQIDPGPLGNMLEGAIRPGHFTGMATVVAKLFLQVMPDYACFGEKDYQQLQIVQQIVNDLSIPVGIVPVPIMRDADGLALSSRNAYLSATERKQAALLPQTMFDVAQKLRDGGDAETALEEGKKRLTEGGFRVDYLTLVDGRTLEPITAPQKNARLLVAARLGKTRLLDNTNLLTETPTTAFPEVA